jgi:hypothetical protein
VREEGMAAFNPERREVTQAMIEENLKSGK